MSDYLFEPMGLLADLEESIDSVLIYYELKILCSEVWDELADKERGEILLLIDTAKAFSDGLESETSTPGGKFARAMIELGERIGDLNSRHVKSLSTANSESALNNANENWSKKLRPIIGIILADRAESLWKQHKGFKLSTMAQLLAEVYSPIILKNLRKISKEGRYAWMKTPLSSRCKNEKLKKGFVRKLLDEEDRKRAFIPASARTPGPSKLR